MKRSYTKHAAKHLLLFEAYALRTQRITKKLNSQRLQRTKAQEFRHIRTSVIHLPVNKISFNPSLFNGAY